MSTVIWWIRRDFRLIDNLALSAALRAADSVLPVFIYDPLLMGQDAPRKQEYLRGVIRCLAEQIAAQGGRLILREGDPLQVMHDLRQETGATAIFAEADITPYARRRDESVAAELPLHLSAGVTAIPSELVLKADGDPYTVFTPFSKTWKNLPLREASFSPPRVRWADFPGLTSLPLPQTNPISPADSLDRLVDFTGSAIYQYRELRDRVDLNGTSRLSPDFHLGLISAAQAATLARRAMQQTDDVNQRKSAETWLNEVIWREFYASILYHFPFVHNAAFRENYRSMQWRHAPQDLFAWQQGLTGYPIVDAAMRQLNQTGWMHNRARMIVASFLVKDLLIDWHEGETYFMRQLIDGDIASNNGGWQWTAGVGTDAAPYFRIFNPVLQSKKYDPQGDYIRRYLPELADLPNKFLHEPWLMSQQEQQTFGVKLGDTYPMPVVDHYEARERTLLAYGNASG
jgi:deoxyribodipyrimidine photo-lyase